MLFIHNDVVAQVLRMKECIAVQEEAFAVHSALRPICFASCRHLRASLWI